MVSRGLSQKDLWCEKPKTWISNVACWIRSHQTSIGLFPFHHWVVTECLVRSLSDGSCLAPCGERTNAVRCRKYSRARRKRRVCLEMNWVLCGTLYLIILETCKYVVYNNQGFVVLWVLGHALLEANAPKCQFGSRELMILAFSKSITSPVILSQNVLFGAIMWKTWILELNVFSVGSHRSMCSGHFYRKDWPHCGWGWWLNG